MNEERSENICAIPIGEMAVSNGMTDVLVVYGLGSCVAICLYDPVVRIGGMLHALLPTDANTRKGLGKPTKFVDQGTTLLVNALLRHGARRERLIAYLCGGARMLYASGLEDSLNIGERNVVAAQSALRAEDIQIYAQAIGGHVGRTVRLYIASGEITMQTLHHSERVLKKRKITTHLGGE